MDWRMTRHTTRGRSLLSKTLMHFALCAAICFVLTAPLFYLLTKWFYAEDLIEIVEAVKERQMIPDIDLERDIVGGMMLQFMLIFIVITIALFVTMRLATKKLWHPFDDTLRKAEQFSLAQGSVPQFASTGIVEFARLNHTLEQLMLNAKHTYIAQKEFTENASHELQTPLAIVRTKLDLLMQGNLGEGEMRLVADLYELTMRMSRLNRNLLLLAKIENSQYADMQKVDVAAMIADAAPLYDALTDGTAIRLADLRSHAHACITANPVLLECLVKNLVVNAIRHSEAGADVELTLTDNSLTVSNAATGDKPLDAKALFRRFSTADAPHKGNGLGLAIVKAVCRFHHWDVAYRYELHRHLFVVKFNTTF